MESMYSPLVHNRTMPSCTVIPVLAYNNVETAIEWLCRTFGFTERWRAGNHRAQLSFGEGTIAVTAQSQQTDGTTSSQHISPHHSLMVRVSDVTAHYEHTTRHGAQVLLPPADFPYGERQYTVTDIGGHIWTFSQSIADLLPEDWGGKSGHM